MLTQYRVLPQRNQFGMIVIVDMANNIVKFTKTVTAAGDWIVKNTKNS